MKRLTLLTVGRTGLILLLFALLVAGCGGSNSTDPTFGEEVNRAPGGRKGKPPQPDPQIAFRQWTSTRVKMGGKPEYKRRYEIGTMNADGSNVTVLPPPLIGGGTPTYESSGTPCWSPDGQQLCFSFPVTDDPDDPVMLYTRMADGSDGDQILSRLTDEIAHPVQPGLYEGQPDWWGNQIAFTRAVSSGEPDEQLPHNVVIDLVTGEETRLTYDPTIAQGGSCWSPDGQWIVFGAGWDWDIGPYIVPSPLQQAPPPGGWTPDSWVQLKHEGSPIIGRETVVWSPPEGGLYKIAYRDMEIYWSFGVAIWVVECDPVTGLCSTPVPLTDPEDDWYDVNPTWSPDGQYLAFESLRPPGSNFSYLRKIRVDGTDLEVLTGQRYPEQENPDWSPVLP